MPPPAALAQKLSTGGDRADVTEQLTAAVEQWSAPEFDVGVLDSFDVAVVDGLARAATSA